MLDIVNNFPSFLVQCNEEASYISNDTRMAIMQGVKQILDETVQTRNILTRAASIEQYSGLLTALSGVVSVISDKGLWVAAQKQRENGRV